MDYTVKTSLPFHFEKLDTSIDERFTRVLIYIAHVGLNLNNSIFSKNLLDSMIPSLEGIPIVGYISEDTVNDIDFNGHEERITVMDGDIKYSYLGRAYGFIGSDNNARFEFKDVDGEQVEFLVCEGQIWNKFSECKEIFDRDSSKGQSMEILPTSIKGKFEKDGHFHFTNAMFEAACILGENVNAAMKGSTIEKFSTQFKDSILKEVENYNKHFEHKGGKSLKNFTWSASQLREELSRIISEAKKTDDWGYEYCDHYYVDHLTDESVVVVYDYESRSYVGFTYSIVGDVISVDMNNKERYKSAWAKMDVSEGDSNSEDTALVPEAFSEYLSKVKEAETKNTFSQTVSELETKNSELIGKVNEFEAKFSEIEKDKHDAAASEAFVAFSKELTEDEMKDIKAKKDCMSLEDINTHLYALVGKKKAKFSTKSVEKEETVKIKFAESQSRNNDEKPWADLVK